MVQTMIVSFFLLMTGTSMVIIWIMELGKNTEINMSRGFFRAREKQSQNLFWFHIVAELATGVMLIASGIILLIKDINSYPLIYFSLGALFYASLNSLGWALAERERRNYAWPIMAGLVVSVVSLIILII